MPNLEDFDWMRDVIAGLVKYDLAEPTTDDRAQHDVKKEVDESFWIRARCVNPKDYCFAPGHKRRPSRPVAPQHMQGHTNGR
jgi:hypothetical protein